MPVSCHELFSTRTIYIIDKFRDISWQRIHSCMYVFGGGSGGGGGGSGGGGGGGWGGDKLNVIDKGCY